MFRRQSADVDTGEGQLRGMRSDRGRLLIAGTALALSVLILVFPPWRARAIRTTTRYAAVANVAPATVVDTVTWTIRALPLFDRPKAPLTAAEGRELSRRAQTGDMSAKRRLLAVMDPFERRVKAPDILQTGGELWRDSVLSAAQMPSVSSYDVDFTLDDSVIALRLSVVLLLAFIVDRRRVAVSSPRVGGGDHKPAPVQS